jgi:hypothetical protein
MPPGTPLPQEITAVSAVASLPANAGCAAIAAKRHPAKMDHTRCIALILTCPRLPSER